MFEVTAFSREEAEIIANGLTLILNWNEPYIIHKGEVIEEIKENLWRINIIKKEA